VVSDLLQPRGVVGEQIERDGGAAVLEQRGKGIVEQRQPMLHALMLAPRRDRLVQRIVAGDRAEQSDITLAEGADDLGRQRHLAHRQELDDVAARRGALRIGVEGSDRFQRVAEEIEPDRIPSRGIEVENAAAHGILPGIGDGAGARIAGDFRRSISSCMPMTLPG
jgi:hypothetical protein